MSDDAQSAARAEPAARPTPAPVPVDLRPVAAAGTGLWLAALVTLALLDAAGVTIPRLGPAVCLLGAAVGVLGYGASAWRSRRRH